MIKEMIFIPAVTLWLCLSMLVHFILCVFCSLGLDQFCGFDKVYSIKQCYAALGHKLNLQMNLNPPYEGLRLYKTLNNGSRQRVFGIKKNKEYDYESIGDRSEFFKNVTLIINKHESIRNRSEFFFDNMTLTINNVIRADSGIYRSFVTEIDMNTASDIQVIVEGIQALSNVFYFRNVLRLMLIIC